MLIGILYVSGHVYLVIMISDLVGLKRSASFQCLYTEGVCVRHLVIFYIISKRSGCLEYTHTMLSNHSRSYQGLPILCLYHVRECVITNLFCATNIAEDSCRDVPIIFQDTLRNWCRLGIVYVFLWITFCQAISIENEFLW